MIIHIIPFILFRININEILGKSVVIHDMRDDFITQLSGDSGTKIGCGVIEKA
ncbi:MAG: superoxide dismutase family protein [Lachnospiraceae bacterium]|nr:superoxide dismutase family protein [Lachnospiraceae bacterium]